MRKKKGKEKFGDITTGKLKDRRFGLRIDDEVEAYIIAGDVLKVVRGRLLSYRKDLHIIDEEGFYHKISFDWVADLIVLRHNRPHPSVDDEIEKKPPPKPDASEQGPPKDHAFM